MYPTLSALIQDLFGINLPLPIQMFGFMVALCFLIGGYVIKLELLRKKNLGYFVPVQFKTVEGLPATQTELITNGALGFFLGYKLVYIAKIYAQFTANPPAYIFNLEGDFLSGIIGAVALAYYTYYQKNKAKLDKPIERVQDVYPHEQIGTILIISAVSGIIGAKIFHNLENIDDFLRNPVASLLSFSGLTFYGGLIFGITAVWYFCKKNKMSFVHTMDAAAPGLMLGYAIGRVGCHLSGDGDWGIVNTLAKPGFLPDWAWSYTYPHNVLSEGVPIAGCVGQHCMQLPQGVFPTPLYEAIACFIFFILLWSIRKKITIPGMMISIYLFLNGFERFFIEKIRVNTLYHLGSFSFTQAELISSLLMLFGLFHIWYSYKIHKTRGAA